MKKLTRFDNASNTATGKRDAVTTSGRVVSGNDPYLAKKGDQ
jgi:hypothetical protein